MKSLRHTATIVLLAMLMTSVGPAQEIVDEWQYTLEKPQDGWQEPNFDPAGWKQGRGGFGTRDTPGSRIGTIWATNGIWLRKTFELTTVPAKPALLIHHDEDVEVFVNGKNVVTLSGYTADYKVVPLSAENTASLTTGMNVMAVHCRQQTGGQFVDVHLIDADQVPDLPPAAGSNTLFDGIDDAVGRTGHRRKRLDRVPASADAARPMDQPERALGLRRDRRRSAGSSHRLVRQDPGPVLPGVQTRWSPTVARCFRSPLVSPIV